MSSVASPRTKVIGSYDPNISVTFKESELRRLYEILNGVNTDLILRDYPQMMSELHIAKEQGAEKFASTLVSMASIMQENMVVYNKVKSALREDQS